MMNLAKILISISVPAGGVATVYSAQPLDTVKVKLQTFPQLYTGMIDCLVKTFKRDGIYRGLYAGSIPAVAANVAENSVLFAAYGVCQKFVAEHIEKKSNVSEMSALGNATSGFLAAFFSSFTLCPTELIKCKLQALHEMKQEKRVTPYQLTKQIIKTEGIKGMFRGLTPTFFREMPGYFFFFGGYEFSRDFLAKPGQSKDDIGPLKTMVAGAAGGCCLWTSIFPADVIKSRVQIQGISGSMLSVGIDICRKEGVLSLYNGLTPTICRTIPATAVLFLVYEYSKKFMLEFL